MGECYRRAVEAAGRLFASGRGEYVSASPKGRQRRAVRGESGGERLDVTRRRACCNSTARSARGRLSMYRRNSLARIFVAPPSFTAVSVPARNLAYRPERDSLRISIASLRPIIRSKSFIVVSPKGWTKRVKGGRTPRGESGSGDRLVLGKKDRTRISTLFPRLREAAIGSGSIMRRKPRTDTIGVS